MAIEKMLYINIIGKMDNLDNIIRSICLNEDFHPENATEYLSDAENYTSLGHDNPFADAYLQYNEIKYSLSPPTTTITIDDTIQNSYGFDQKIAQLNKKLDYLNSQKAELLKSISENENSIEQLKHFKGLNINLEEIFECTFTKVRFGRLPIESYKKLDLYENNNPYLVFHVCSVDEHYYWGMYMAPYEKIKEIDVIFSKLFFTRIRIPGAKGTPLKVIEKLQRETDAAKARLFEVEKELALVWQDERSYYLEHYASIETLYRIYEFRKKVARYVRYKDLFHIVGWIPQKNKQHFASLLEGVQNINYSFEAAHSVKEANPPTRLKNNRFTRPFEMFVEMFGLPSYHEVDPTPFVAITYSILYGIMFADLGQGFVILAGGYVLWKLKRLGLGRILMRCGFFSCIFGTLLGSVFGYEHALSPITRALFNKDKLFDTMSPGNTNIIIYSAISIGIVLIAVSMLINIYSSIRQKKYDNAIFGYNGIAGLVFYCSVVAGAALLLLGNKNIFSPPYILLLNVVPLLLIFFKEPLYKLLSGKGNIMPESISDFLLENFFELFESLLTYISNTISFLRIGAYVLVHSGMMLVVFTLAEIVPQTLSIVVIIIGNAIVIGLEGLLVGIQCLRLEFYEMFSRFYSGDGSPFKSIYHEESAQ